MIPNPTWFAKKSPDREGKTKNGILLRQLADQDDGGEKAQDDGSFPNHSGPDPESEEKILNQVQNDREGRFRITRKD